MKKSILLSFLILLVAAIAITPAEAQTKKKKSGTDKYFDESGQKFSQKLWYGANLGLGFNGGLGYSYFNMSLFPMVGYKILKPLSVGPRVGVNYTYLKGVASDGNIHGVALTDYSFGPFARLKFLNYFFVHSEYEVTFRELLYGDQNGDLIWDSDNQKIYTERAPAKSNFYAGLGYTSGQEFSYEISVLYNFLEPENSQNLPFYIRAGFTYRF